MENCEFIIQCNPYDKTLNYKRRDAKKEWQRKVNGYDKAL